MTAAVILEILQSENGGDFLGECVRMVQKHFNTIKIVKGRARKPLTQGSVERGNKTFKQSLFEWIEQNKSESWAEVGAYIVNAHVNQRPSQSKDNQPPYEV